MGRDKILIEEFVRGYNQWGHTAFHVTDLPDELERQKQAIDTIARDDQGQTLAIEHTLIQPFVGEKHDAQPLLTVIRPLEVDHSLRIPGKSIDVSVAVGAIPKGPDWRAASAKLVAWFREIRLALPRGQSVHRLPDVGFDLTLRIYVDNSPYPEGRVYVMRSGMPEDFQSVVRKALEDKLPKLAKTPADRRILLFEMDNAPRSSTKITDTLETLRDDFPDLDAIDEVWCPLTAARDTERRYIVTRAWPRSDAEWPYFTVSVKRLEIPKEKIAEFCRRRHIRKLALFGSVLRDDFSPGSDLDILVEFEPDHIPGLEFFSMEAELSQILGRKVDLNTPQFLGRCFRDGVLAASEVQYVEP